MSDARIEAAAKAEYEHWDFSEEAPWEEAGVKQDWHREAAVAMLAASDSVERPAVERLVAALADAEAMLVVAATFAHNVGQGASSLAFQHTAENAHALLAEFGQQPTGDERE